jgi:phosphate transport system protein
MPIHFHRQIEKLKAMILKLGGIVEQRVFRAVEAVENRSLEISREVIIGDSEIDQMEVDIEEECLHALALHQPVSLDLRYVASVLKINNDLERIADLAVNIAEQAEFLAREVEIPIPPDLLVEAEKACRMLKMSLDSLVHLDEQRAESVRRMDDEVDDLHRQMYLSVKESIKQRPDQVDQSIHILNISRQLERIADHAVNIAEDVIYAVRGEITRHNRPHLRARA